MHLLLDGVNNFRKTIKLPFYTSATALVQNCQVLYPSFIESATHDQLIKELPECTSNKEVSFYLFEIKDECYHKNGIKKTYNRTARVDKKKKVSEIVRMLLVQSSVYLGSVYLRSHVDNISKVLPLIKETFNGRYIELDFSENLAMKPKIEPQDAHISGKQFTLHCTIVLPGQPNMFIILVTTLLITLFLFTRY